MNDVWLCIDHVLTSRPAHCRGWDVTDWTFRRFVVENDGADVDSLHAVCHSDGPGGYCTLQVYIPTKPTAEELTNLNNQASPAHIRKHILNHVLPKRLVLYHHSHRDRR